MDILGQGCTRSDEDHSSKDEIRSRSTNNNGTAKIFTKNDTDSCNGLHDINKVNVLYTNARSLSSGTKWKELKILIDNNSIDIIGTTETWGTPDIFDCEMEIPGFKLYKKDRSVVNDKKGGGVALYIKNTLNSVECDSLNAESCESVWCRITADKSNSFVVGVCYRSPDADGNEVDILFQTIKTACTNNKSVLILEDFNYPNIDWVTFREGGNSDYEFNIRLLLGTTCSGWH